MTTIHRSTFDLKVQVTFPEGTDPEDSSIAILDALRAVPGFETARVYPPKVTTVRGGVCRYGEHTFGVPDTFPDSKQVPPFCRQHAYQAAIDEAAAEHRPLFEAVKALTGLTGHIWQSGGMTMTFVFPIGDRRPGTEEDGPGYMGLKEHEVEGRWHGSCGFFTDLGDQETDRDVFVQYAEQAETPQQWAQRIADDFFGGGLLDAMIAQAKREILADIEAGTVPGDVTDFSDLHQYVDANAYGGLCDEGRMWAPADADEQTKHEAWRKIGDDLHDALHAWLAAGRAE